MKFTVEIDCDNAAFTDNAKGEIIRCLNTMTSTWQTTDSGPIIDTNGNMVGKFKLERDEK